jgi:hypothetical protein
MVGTWKWHEKDYETPLIFPLDGGATAYLYLDNYDAGKRDREVLWEATLQIRFSPPPQKLVKGLTSNSKSSGEVADKIYSYYEDVFDKFESIARTAGNIKNLMINSKTLKKEFFKNGILSGEKVTWWIDKEKPNIFIPKLKKDRRQLNPLFKKEQIITKAKWKKMQTAIDNNDFPSEEMLELLRIRAKLEWKQKKIATIESAILIETILRNYGEKVLQSLGLSKTKIKSLKNEMSFSSVLNIVLPLTISKSKLGKVDKHLKSVDVLRKLRNDVVHGNIQEEAIEEDKVRNGIEGALVLIEVLRKKLK